MLPEKWMVLKDIILISHMNNFNILITSPATYNEFSTMKLLADAKNPQDEPT